jgi:hypothetical protein
MSCNWDHSEMQFDFKLHTKFETKTCDKQQIFTIRSEQRLNTFCEYKSILSHTISISWSIKMHGPHHVAYKSIIRGTFLSPFISSLTSWA